MSTWMAPQIIDPWPNLRALPNAPARAKVYFDDPLTEETALAGGVPILGVTVTPSQPHLYLWRNLLYSPVWVRLTWRKEDVDIVVLLYSEYPVPSCPPERKTRLVTFPELQHPIPYTAKHLVVLNGFATTRPALTPPPAIIDLADLDPELA